MLIVAVLKEERVSGTVNDFLHHYRDRYQDWAVKRNLKAPRKRF